jgi:hypothetical protein
MRLRTKELINCAAAAWQEENKNKLVQFQKLFLETEHIRVALAALASQSRALHDRPLQNARFAVPHVLQLLFGREKGPLLGLGLQ